MKPKYLADDSENSSDEVIFQGNLTGPQSSATNDPTKPKERLNSCRALQKKLELKVERAKRNYKQLHQDEGADWDVCITQPKSTNLIPISRLQFPGREENQNLIEYRETNNGDDDLDDDLTREELRFFANKSRKSVKQDLSDTFSIQEMTIESDSDESGSDTLELLPPTDAQYWERIATVFPCCGSRHL